jgi:hypothetical protein
VGYFYFDCVNPERQTASIVVRSLLRQLASCLEHIPPELNAPLFPISAQKKSARYPPTSTFIVSRLLPSSFIVLDALDECRETELRVILDILEKLTDICESPKIYMISRPYIAE